MERDMVAWAKLSSSEATFSWKPDSTLKDLLSRDAVEGVFGSLQTE